MRMFSIQHYVLIGLFAWGLPGIYVGGIDALYFTLAAALPLLTLAKLNTKKSFIFAYKVKESALLTIVLFTLIYIFFDALIGRQKLDVNMFLARTATSSFIDNANQLISKGRGIIELLGAIFIALPFAMIDTARVSKRAGCFLLWAIAIIYIFYDSGISRGYILIAMISVLLSYKTNLKIVIIAVCLALSLFFAASFARGDFDEVAFFNPLLDAIVLPYINLQLLIENNCSVGNSINYISEFLKKFLPGFIVNKEVFSFNIEMTKCIYPFYANAVASISIFTWLGEMYYYSPGIQTALISGILLAFLCRLVDIRLEQLHLYSVRIFSGLMCIVLLRSRIQDVFSFLLFLIIFLILWQAITITKHHSIKKNKNIAGFSA